MPTRKINFTDNRLRKLTHDGSKKRLILFDERQPGLALQLTPAGTKTFQFRHWDKNRRQTKTLTIGKYPTVSINEARTIAANHLVELNKGIDIVEASRRFKEEDTFADLFDKWISGPGKMKRTRTGMAQRSKRNVDEDRQRYKLYIEKPLGNKRISWFTPDRIRKWHTKLLKQKKQPKRGTGTISPATANQAFSLVRRVFNAIMPEYPNPCTGVSKFSEQSRDRFLQPDELKRFFEALYHEDTPELLRDYVLVSLFTGARRSNVLSMRWNEISYDRRVWTVPANKSKNGEPMDIPLVDEADDVLQRRKKTSNSVFVFPGSGKTGHYSEPKRAWRTLLKRAKLTDVRLHDLRRTMGSYQTMTGASTAIVGKTLGHRSSNATAVYARLNLDPVRASMESAVDAMLATRELPDKVVNIKKAHCE